MYYRDLGEKRSQMVAPLTDLIGECGETKTTRKNMLAYPDYSKPFEIYTDASTRQLGAVITQGNRPLAFFQLKVECGSRKVQYYGIGTSKHRGMSERIHRHALGTKDNCLY